MTVQITDNDPQFSTGTTITNTATGAVCVYAIDLYGNSDNDVLSASETDDRIDWYENDPVAFPATGFSPGTDITSTADGAASVFAIDLDGDGDNYVLSASRFDNRIVWYENLLIP